MGASTVITVTQRVSTAMKADQIIVLDHGAIVGAGTHEELLDSCALYQEIAHSQLSKEDLAHGHR
jgi:ATP-binding cassette subfamily B protein